MTTVYLTPEAQRRLRAFAVRRMCDGKQGVACVTDDVTGERYVVTLKQLREWFPDVVKKG